LSPAAFRRLWLAAVLAFAAFIAWSSLAPTPPVSAPSLSDKLQHFVAYLALTLLASGIAMPGRLWLTAFRCFLLGGFLEIAQGLLTTTRQAEWGDLAANTAGILAAWIIAGGGRAGWGLRALERVRRASGS
jgi:VanZ family protein